MFDAGSNEFLATGSSEAFDSKPKRGFEVSLLSFLSSLAGGATDGKSVSGLEDGTWTWLALSAISSASLLAFNASIALAWLASITIFENNVRFPPAGGLKRVLAESPGASAPLIVTAYGARRFWPAPDFLVVTNPSLSSLLAAIGPDDAEIRSG